MENLIRFVEACETGTGRSTFYNSATQQTDSIESLHKEALNADRELYCLMEALSGSNDFNKLLIVRNLLFHTGYVIGRQGSRKYVRYGKSEEFAVKYGDDPRERDWIDLENRVVLERVWNTVPVPRLLREWAEWRKLRLNNARSKRLILEYLLGRGNLSSWALRYRPKLRRVLSHVWGDARTRRIRSAIHTILRNETEAANQKELERWMLRYVRRDEEIRRRVCEAVCFIFGDLKVPFTDPLFVQYVQALEDPEKLIGLPYDIAIGLRNRRHKDFPRKRLLESAETQQRMSARQKVRLQRAGQREDVRVDMDLAALPLVDILRFGYEMGFDSDVRRAVKERIRSDAEKCPFRPGRIAVVVDTSRSMFGKEDRKLHPIAAALSVALLLREVSGRCDIFYTGGGSTEFPIPSGDTDLATAVLEAYKTDPEIVFLLTDGYENVSAGTLDELLGALHTLGIKTPLVQLSPVLASEVGKAGGIRKVSDSIFAGAVKGPESIGTMYEKFVLLWAHEQGALDTLKKFLLEKLALPQIPQSVLRQLEHAEALPIKAFAWPPTAG